MKTISLYSTLLLLSGSICSSLPSARATTVNIVHTFSTDSLRIEKKDGKRFIVHRVDEGQTLYAISRKYKRSVAEIKAANPEMKDAVRYDQLILIPVPDGTLSRKEEKVIDKAIKKQEKEAKREAREREKETEKVTEAKPVAKAEKIPEKEVKKSDDPAQSGIHVVEAGQTLYSLANRYGVSQADIRKWNNLPGNNVLIGQPLIVSEKAYQDRTPSNSVVTTKSPDAPSRPTPAHPVDTNTNESRPHESRPTPHTEPKSDHRNENDTPTRPSATGTKPSEPEPEPPRPGNDAPMPTQGRRISSSGVAEMIEGTDGSGKYLALHRTAPIGTLVQVRNEFNNQSLWVKVIGRLPNTGINDKILIKLSSQAFAKLSPEDRRFRAEVSYIVR
ncbi:LysM peptidoglycan-binding domain-containing protein [Spirosoma aerolatum]|uniref:LysM peptidoglycan-binding domain-containing protein n=1 Tax=Spirosoma aerolatum TaxID=1211326 RepID=UPI0009AE941B|nr:LysM peptidoglycan-binding domain-containing protein [Spirosoma aerolatum]